MKNIEIKISGKLSGKTVKEILFGELKLSARLVTRLKKTGGITVNGEAVTVRKEVQCGDVLNVVAEDEPSENIVPCDIPLDVIYEDEDILLVNKPAGMPVHPSFGHYEDTLANAVMYRYRDRNFSFRAVSRIDRDTTGLVLIALNRFSADFLCRQMRERKISKEYLAVCCGVPENKSGKIEAPIMRENESVIKRIVDENGQYSLTEYEMIYSDGVYSVIRAFPHTGRTHQIRVHLSYIGIAIYGDFIYGEEIQGEPMRLHCSSLGFVHPSDGSYVKFNAEPPEYFLSMMKNEDKLNCENKLFSLF